MLRPKPQREVFADEASYLSALQSWLREKARLIRPPTPALTPRQKATLRRQKKRVSDAVYYISHRREIKKRQYERHRQRLRTDSDYLSLHRKRSNLYLKRYRSRRTLADPDYRTYLEESRRRRRLRQLANETPEQRKQRTLREQQSTKRWLAAQSPEWHRNQREQQRLYTQDWWAKQTPEQRSMRWRAYKQHCIENETPEEREARLARQRVYSQRSRQRRDATETADERAARKEKTRLRDQRYRQRQTEARNVQG